MKKVSIYLGLYSIFVVLLLTGYLRTTLPFNTEYGVDVYYHITMADLFPDIWKLKHFEWTQLSIWKDHFFDKELGFHFLLFCLRKWEYILGISSHAPFNFISLSLIFILMTAYFYGASRLAPDTAWIITLLLYGLSPLFLLRIIMIRPHILSIILFGILIFILYSYISFEKKLFSVAIIGFLYIYCYSTPQLMFIPIISFGLSEFIFAKKINIRTFKHFLLLCLAGLAGIVCGMIFHPQFPNSFYIWYIQNVLVWKQILGHKYNIGLGTELTAPSLRTHMENSGIYFLFFVNIILFVKLKRIHPYLIALLLCQWFVLVGFFFSERCIEYIVPSEAICFIILLQKKYYSPDQDETPGNTNISTLINIISDKIILLLSQYIKIKNKVYVKKTLKNTFLFLFGIVFFLFFLPHSLNTFSHLLIEIIKPGPRKNSNPALRKYLLPYDFNNIRKYSPCTDFGKWASGHLRSGVYIGQIRWGEFPRLFFAAPQFRYSMALDPTFTYVKYPHKIEALEQFRMLKRPLTPAQLYNILETPFLFVSKYDPIPAKHLIALKTKLLYAGKDGWCFFLLK